MIPVLIDTAKTLRSSQRRLFMAKAVDAMGPGGQAWAEDHLGWNRQTIRKGMHELRTGMTCVDAFHCRRRKPAEEHLPRLLEDIRAIADPHRQPPRQPALARRRRRATRPGDPALPPGRLPHDLYFTRP
jgi:hypothetical protein